MENGVTGGYREIVCSLCAVRYKRGSEVVFIENMEQQRGLKGTNIICSKHLSLPLVTQYACEKANYTDHHLFPMILKLSDFHSGDEDHPLQSCQPFFPAWLRKKFKFLIDD